MAAFTRSLRVEKVPTLTSQRTRGTLYNQRRLRKPETKVSGFCFCGAQHEKALDFIDFLIYCSTSPLLACSTNSRFRSRFKRTVW